MKYQIKKAFDLAENEVEEKQIEHLKKIIKNLLETKKKKEENRRKLEDDIKLIKQDIDDFKAGRLDKIKERHETDEKANEVAPVNITIINDNHRTLYPTQPWRWNYEVVWVNPNICSNSSYTTCSSSALTATCTDYTSFNGTGYATFTSGTYKLEDGTITNL